MEEKIIDCSRIQTKEDLHRIFRESLSFPAWYGNNLDRCFWNLTVLAEISKALWCLALLESLDRPRVLLFSPLDHFKNKYAGILK